MVLKCVFMLHFQVIAYASRKLNPREKNYPTHDLELAIVVFSLNILRYCLYGVHGYLFTYHKSVEYVFTKGEATYAKDDG